jgi:hypothetical protein
MIYQAKNPEYITSLEIILKGIEGKKYIEETKQPRYMSLVIFGENIFPFKIEQYREMIKLI